jgi:ribokinase
MLKRIIPQSSLVNRYLRVRRALTVLMPGKPTADDCWTPLHAMVWLRVHPPSVAGDLLPSSVGAGTRPVKFADPTAVSCIMSLLPDLSEGAARSSWRTHWSPMTNRTDMVSPDALVLTHALEKLRARDGLTHSRLDNSRSVEAAPLLGLSAVRRHAAVHDMELAQAALDVIKECVREGLHGSQRIVADAVLGLGTFSETYTRHDIEPRVVSALHSDLLGRRRGVLLSNWRVLHEALDLPPIEPPSDRALRGTIERDVLGELARQLIRREEYSLGSKSVVMPYTSENSSRKIPMSRSGRVIVLGGAVMDATFRTKMLPSIGTSSEAYGFQLAPGGKGLWQAVAAARLGLDVALVAAVADDKFGHGIVNYLRDEGVDTSLLKLVDDAQTPFTGVIEFELGDSLALNWPNQREVRLDIRDVDRLGQRFGTYDAVLLTFEIPHETLQYTLALVNRLEQPRPVVIVTPGQPYPDAGLSGQALSQIDYLVAHPWELGRYKPPDRQSFDLDVAARQLLANGVETLCVPTDGGCYVYSEPLGTFNVPTFPSPYKESSVARDAFCAALAAKLIDSGRHFSEEVVLWATTAMAAEIADHPLPNPMPDRRRVEQLLERSRFDISPRETYLNDAGDAYPEQGQPSFPH